MYLRSLAVLALGSIALGQAAPRPLPSTPPRLPNDAIASRPSRSAPGATSTVAPHDPVITIRGLCDTTTVSKAAKPVSSKAAPDCKTIVTRAQFEALANALQPAMPPAMKKKLAELYPTMLVMSHTAQKRGYDNGPEFKKLMEFSRIQVLSAQLNRAVQKEAENVPPADIDKYYKENSATFEQISLQRIFVPKGRGPQPANDKSGGAATEPVKSDEDAAKNEAEFLQTRAAAGEDFDKLQTEALDFAGVTTPASSTSVRVLASELPAAQSTVLDLKPGQVSHVLADSNGYFIYKLVGKEQKPLDDKSREDIKSRLAHQKFQSTMDELHKSFVTTLSDVYFGTEPAQAGPTAAAKVQVPETTTAKPAAPQPAEPPK
jgi:PPIC-type PPIASE domain